MIRQIVLATEPIIRRKLKPVRKFDDSLKSLVSDLIDTMTFANGAGIAANQIGDDRQVFVVGIGAKPQVFINPKLKILASKDDSLDEGCLSVPGYRGSVKRAGQVEITFDDLKGKRHKLLAKGFLAKVLQHEYDHLQGKLYIDHIDDPKDIQKVEPVKVVFFGSGEFAVPILVSLIGLNWTFDFQTIGVVTQPPRPTGRAKTLSPTPIAQAATHFGLQILTPAKLDAKFITDLKKWKPDLIILADYGKILPEALLDLPAHGALNLHPSLLPKYRGATPIQQAIVNADELTGVSLIKMDPQVDSGGILSQYQTKIDQADTYLSLSDRLAQLAAVMIRDILPYYISGELKPEPQPKSGVILAPKLTTEDGLINNSDSAEVVLRKVRAFNPEPGAYLIWNNKRVKILSAHLDEGTLKIDFLQMEGGKLLSWQDFKNGYPEFSLPWLEMSAGK